MEGTLNMGGLDLFWNFIRALLRKWEFEGWISVRSEEVGVGSILELLFLGEFGVGEVRCESYDHRVRVAEQQIVGVLVGCKCLSRWVSRFWKYRKGSSVTAWEFRPEIASSSTAERRCQAWAKAGGRSSLGVGEGRSAGFVQWWSQGVFPAMLAMECSGHGVFGQGLVDLGCECLAWE